MIRTYVINIGQLEEEAAFQTALSSVSSYRRRKAGALKNGTDRCRSLGASLALDAALRFYGLREKSMEYVLGNQGKPMFCDYPDLHFSLSHSGGYALCSMGGQELGSDIERVRPGKLHVAERFFAEEEKAWLYRANLREERESRMFRIWTMKESFLKATGLGMSLPLRDFTVCIEEDEKVSLHHALNNNTYYIKEYALPAVFREAAEYKISVCSVSPEFAPEPEAVFL
ncbi:MAG: 4'-phosphopantetheinyl transferase superfamily protein [Blautia sp.]|nr:4'-phosphopantetheinyl transferase superfamily protein [Blautia sp.]MCM1200686.1 4'-phosphopantetheinyl transferase superfamily protein [Bacteroides fragilis]